MRTDVGIGDFHASGKPGELIKTYALGSCVAVLMYDKVRRIAGMIHVALPESRVNAEKAETRPGYFADTGIPALLKAFSAAGGDQRKAQIKIAGGASILDENRTFDIGRRNVIAIKRALWKYGLGVIAEDVGGKISRTVSIEVDTGTIVIHNAKNSWTI
ncbi:chemotaxis protein CheD [Marispirochaeta aestuarii]|uniref:chemotaxis protein CheD n=1 Tax=Marispirochaeta aestuarii TaxID=1963862 RepID=UPI0029C8BABA|nr:chemotaxis protein CheD [Marispirochaeta aestuarii]